MRRRFGGAGGQHDDDQQRRSGDQDGSSKKKTKHSLIIPPEKTSPVKVPRFDRPPVIDGKLDDDVWQHAARLKDFYQTSPGDNIAPSQKTEVLLGYDSRFLYVAFHCFDDPTKVRANLAKRDDIFNDDYVGVFLDTLNDQRKAYELFFNPLGVQQDGILTEGTGEDFSGEVRGAGTDVGVAPVEAGGCGRPAGVVSNERVCFATSADTLA